MKVPRPNHWTAEEFSMSNNFVQLSTQFFIWEIHQRIYQLHSIFFPAPFFSSWKQPSWGLPLPAPAWTGSSQGLVYRFHPGILLPYCCGNFLCISPVLHSLFDGSHVFVLIGLLLCSFFFFNLLRLVLWFSAFCYSCKAWHFPSEQNTHHCFTIMVENCGARSSALICIG